MSFLSYSKELLKKVKESVSVENVIGEPLEIDGMLVIPISSVTFGYGIGGKKSSQAGEDFGGAFGGGATVEPVAFLIVDGEETELIGVAEKDIILEMILTKDNIQKVTHLIDRFRKGDKTVSSEQGANN